MNLPPLSACFPISESLAELYGGWSEGPIFKVSFTDISFEGAIKKANDYLSKHEFIFELSLSDFENEKSVDFNDLTFIKNLTEENQIVLAFHQPLLNKPLDNILAFLNSFREERDWKKFHTSKDLSLAINSEAGELADLFLWDRSKNVDEEKIKNELADIITYCIYLADNHNIDLLDALVTKTISNSKKYPVSKSKGSAKKYNDL
jgi:NTP pyrophosphatase (non-canonical NTP hydrolase)